MMCERHMMRIASRSRIMGIKMLLDRQIFPSSEIWIRHVHASSPHHKVIPENVKGTSSHNWVKRQLNDPYIVKARYENYRCRSAYKLIEIDEKYNILRPGMVAIDCGAAPGAWSQVLVKKLNLRKYDREQDPKSAQSDDALVISIDLNHFHDIDGAIALKNMDFTKPMTQAKILNILDGRLVDIVCSDMAPSASGVRTLDHDRIIKLCYSALTFALPNLRPKSGAFLCKSLSGSNDQRLFDDLSKFFERVHRVKPPSSRSDSTEFFYLATHFKGVKKSS